MWMNKSFEMQKFRTLSEQCQAVSFLFFCHCCKSSTQMFPPPLTLSHRHMTFSVLLAELTHKFFPQRKETKLGNPRTHHWDWPNQSPVWVDNTETSYRRNSGISEAFSPESPDTSDFGRCRAFKTTTVSVFVVDW